MKIQRWMKKKCRLALNLSFLKWSEIKKIKVHRKWILKGYCLKLSCKIQKILINLLKEVIQKYNRLFQNRILFQKLRLINICLIKWRLIINYLKLWQWKSGRLSKNFIWKYKSKLILLLTGYIVFLTWQKLNILMQNLKKSAHNIKDFGLMNQLI